MRPIRTTKVTVTQLNEYISRVLQTDPLLGNISVTGEISNFTNHYRTGHLYFTLKDEKSAIKAVMFRSSAERLRFEPENGMKVIAMGKISVYPRDGAYQLYCTAMAMDGVGDLYAAFEQLKRKLEAQGLFDTAHKKPLPQYPGTIGIVTSSAGAAVHDMIRILRRRYPIAKVILLPVTAKSKRSTMKMSRLQPRIKDIQTRYAHDQQKQNELITKMYQEEGVSMGGGCLWSMVPLFILIPLFTVIREPLTYILGEGAEVSAQIIDVINNKDNTEGLKNINQYVDQILENSTTMQLNSAVRIPAEKEEKPEEEEQQKVGFDTYVSDYVSQKRTSISIIELNTENFSEIVMDVSVDGDIAMSAERLKALLNIKDCGAEITDFTVEDISYDKTNIILVCDVSGSMDGSPIQDLKTAVSMFVNDNCYLVVSNIGDHDNFFSNRRSKRICS